MTNDLECALACLRALYPLDAGERIDCNSDRNTPRFALARTRLGCVWRFRSDLEPARIRNLAKYAAREAGIENPVAAPLPERLEPMRRVLNDGAGETPVLRLVLYCPLQSAPTGSAGDAASAPDGCTASEALASPDAGGQGAISWGDTAGLAELENRSLRIYGDLLLLG